MGAGRNSISHEESTFLTVPGKEVDAASVASELPSTAASEAELRWISDARLCRPSDALLAQISELSRQEFAEDCLPEALEDGSEWILGLFAVGDELQGFVLYQINKLAGWQCIQKVAVPQSCRGRGYGRQMVEQMISMARARGDIDSVTLRSLPAAVGFYKHMGFKATDKNEERDQIFMEFILRAPVLKTKNKRARAKTHGKGRK